MQPSLRLTPPSFLEPPILGLIAVGMLALGLILAPASGAQPLLQIEPDDAAVDCPEETTGILVDADGDGINELIRQIATEPPTTVFYSTDDDCAWETSLTVTGSAGAPDSWGCFEHPHGRHFLLSDWDEVEVQAELRGVRTNEPSSAVEANRHRLWSLVNSEWIQQGAWHYRLDSLAEGIESCLAPAPGPDFWANPSDEGCSLPINPRLGSPLYLDPDGSGRSTAALVPSGISDSSLSETAVFYHGVFFLSDDCWSKRGTLKQRHGDDSVYDQWGCHIDADGELSIVSITDYNHQAGIFSDQAEVQISSLADEEMTAIARFRYNPVTMKSIGTTGCDRDTAEGFDLPAAGPTADPRSAAAVAEYEERCGPVASPSADSGPFSIVVDFEADGSVEMIETTTTNLTTVRWVPDGCGWSRSAAATGSEGTSDSFGCSFTTTGHAFLLDWQIAPIAVNLDGNRTTNPADVELLAMTIQRLRDEETRLDEVYYLPTDALVPDRIGSCLSPTVDKWPGIGAGHRWERTRRCDASLEGLGPELSVDLNEDGSPEILRPSYVLHSREGALILHRLEGDGVTGCLNQISGEGRGYYQWGCHVDTRGDVMIVAVAGNHHDIALADFAEVIVMDLDAEGLLGETRRFPYEHETMSTLGATGCDPETADAVDLPDPAPRPEPASGELVQWQLPLALPPLCVIDLAPETVLPVRSGPGAEFESVTKLRAGSCILRSTGDPVGGWHPIVVAVSTARGPWMRQGWVPAPAVARADEVNTAEAAAVRLADFLSGGPHQQGDPALSETCVAVSEREHQCSFHSWVWYASHAVCADIIHPHWGRPSHFVSTALQRLDGTWEASTPVFVGLAVLC